MNRLKILSLIIYLIWNVSAYAESEETGAVNPFADLAPQQEPLQGNDPFADLAPGGSQNDNPFDQFDVTHEERVTSGGNPFGKHLSQSQPATSSVLDKYKIKPGRKKQPKPEKVITVYYSSIKPGDKLPANVYECTLKNLRGIGSDTAAKIVWQACLRLNLK